MAAVAAAVVVGAIVTLSMVFMMAALDIGIVIQSPCQEGCHRSVRKALYAAVDYDARLSQRHLGTAADAAADQHLHIQIMEQGCQRTVAAAVGAHHLARWYQRRCAP